LVFIPTYFAYLRPTSVNLSLRGPQIILDPSLVYLKFLFRIIKQFSIDFFIDWEGHFWVSALLFQITAQDSLKLTHRFIDKQL